MKATDMDSTRTELTLRGHSTGVRFAQRLLRRMVWLAYVAVSFLYVLVAAPRRRTTWGHALEGSLERDARRTQCRASASSRAPEGLA